MFHTQGCGYKISRLAHSFAFVLPKCVLAATGCIIISFYVNELQKKLGGIFGLSGWLGRRSQIKAELHDANKQTKVFLGHGTEGINPQYPHPHPESELSLPKSDDKVLHKMSALTKTILEAEGPFFPKFLFSIGAS